MEELTLLPQEKIEGKNRLQIFDVIGTKAAPTDFAILLGCDVSSNEHINYDNSLKGRSAYYWTKSNNANGDVIVVDEDGTCDLNNQRHTLAHSRSGGIRPVFKGNFIYFNYVKEYNNQVGEYEFGYFPQMAVKPETQRELEKFLKDGNLFSTGNKYTIDSKNYDEYDEKFSPQELCEYEYLGKRYVRVQAKIYKAKRCILSNGEMYKDQEYVWVEVSPIKWIMDLHGNVISKNILVSGIQFKKDRGYKEEKFKETDLYKYMNEYLVKEMLQVTKTKINKTKTINTYNLDFKKIDEEEIIKNALKSNISIFLHGKPGCGKSERIRKYDPDFIELNLSHMDPELLDGIAGVKDDKEVHIKPPWLEELEEKCDKDKNNIHIVFLEELTNASTLMQGKAYGIALDKKVAGKWKLPENARVVAAGNELEDSTVANEMPQPLYDRFAHVYIDTNAEKWLEWAVSPEEAYEILEYHKKEEKREKIHPAIYAYISYRGDMVLRTPYDKEMPKPHADPRRWKMASDILYESNNPNTLKAIVGEEITADFIAFCKLPTITVEDIINENYTEDDIKIDIGRKYATISKLLKVDEKNMPKVRKFVKKLGAEFVKNFDVQWIKRK